VSLLATFRHVWVILNAEVVAGRLLDRADCAHLLRENREAIDVDYLRWTSKLQLADALREVWREAYGAAVAPPM